MSTSEGPIKIVTLGCAKNDVDSEEIAGVLEGAGFKIDGAASQSQTTIINTCGFLESSKQESIEAIRNAVALKKAGKTGRVIVAGCLAQRLGPELMRLAPGADVYVGVGQMARFAEIVEEAKTLRESKIEVGAPHHRWAEVGTRARTGFPWSAYLKVSEGCDHKCSFCTIPSFRGRHQSKPIERILAEAQNLARSGVKEINLIAQDVTQYGFDLYKEFKLPQLLAELQEVNGIDWIRILYFYPNRLTDEVIEAIATLPKVAHYIDIPLQHAHPDTLRRMKRPWDGERYLKLFEKVRAAIPDIAIRSTFIVGYPGETEAEFDYLLDFISQARLDRVGAFMYSREAGTPAAEEPGQVKFSVKRDRFERLGALQQSISLEINNGWVGRQLKVLIEENREGWSVGRSHRDAPDIDGVVFVEGEHPLGDFVSVQPSAAEAYDLYGKVSSRFSTGDLLDGRRTVRPLRVLDPIRPL